MRPSWLVERGRLETLQHQIVSEWARFADVAEQVITDTQRAAVRDIQDALGGNLNRALTIARTEQMRAYRNASLRSYQDNHELLRGWRWLASPSRRTCPVCLAMDGTEHGLDKPFASHIRCRCVPVPVLHNASPSTRKTGAAWFAEQDEATQRAMLGPGKQQLYAEGKLTLADLVGVKDDAQWGKSRYQRSIGDALAAAAVVPPYPIPQSLGAAVTVNAQLQAERLNQIAELPPEWLGQQIDRMAVRQALPKLDYHYDEHGRDLGATSREVYAQMFEEHIQRTDLMYFTGIRQRDHVVMWYLMAPDTGAVAQYNETRGVYWSFYQPGDPIRQLEEALLWWAEIKREGGQWIAQPWR